MSVEFFLTSLLMACIPGPAVIYCVMIGLRCGLFASLWSAAGCVIALVPAATVSVLSLSAVWQEVPELLELIRVLGIAYLCFVIWQVLRKDSAFSPAVGGTSTKVTSIAITGMLLNMLNPKLVVFLLAFLPQFVPSNAPSPHVEFVWLAAVFGAISFCVFVALGMFAALMRGHAQKVPCFFEALRLCCACALAGFAVQLAIF